MIQNKVMGVPGVENPTKRENSETIPTRKSARGRVYHTPRNKDGE